MIRTRSLFLFALLAVLLEGQTVHAQAPVVHALLFYSPSCPHCHKVMTDDLPPLVRQYGPQLDIVEVNVDTPEGLALYRAAISYYRAEDRLGVPALFVGPTLLVGSRQIPGDFPAIIKAGLASGGVDWPIIPGLDAYLQNYRPPEAVGWLGRFSRDLVANSLAVLVLALMLFTAIWLALQFRRGASARAGRWPAWSIPVLALIGLGVAAYLSYVELTQVEAVCGPIGDCNTVQQSAYARLFGLFPIGVLGVVGYLSMLGAWLLSKTGSPTCQSAGALAVWALAWAGLGFSFYLTFLEPFVIGATCAWCLSSAVVMTLILWASTRPAQDAWQAMKAGPTFQNRPI